MTRFQLVFRREGKDDDSEFRFNDADGEPHIDGELIVDGDTYVIRNVEWIVRRDGGSDDLPRFICTLVAVPVTE
jgi:hypothetical protein